MKHKDLIWTLEGITNLEETLRFIMLFENTFPVYHHYLEQIYFTYSFVIPPRSNQLIVEPSWELQERLYPISEDGFEDRCMYIFPGDVVGKRGLYMKSPQINNKNRFVRSVITKLGTAIKALHFETTMKGEQLIPVFSKQAIRGYEDGMPNMEISLYDLKRNPNLSSAMRDIIVSAVFDRLLKLNFDVAGSQADVQRGST